MVVGALPEALEHGVSLMVDVRRTPPSAVVAPSGRAGGRAATTLPLQLPSTRTTPPVIRPRPYCCAVHRRTAACRAFDSIARGRCSTHASSSNNSATNPSRRPRAYNNRNSNLQPPTPCPSIYITTGYSVYRLSVALVIGTIGVLLVQVPVVIAIVVVVVVRRFLCAAVPPAQESQAHDAHERPQ